MADVSAERLAEIRYWHELPNSIGSVDVCAPATRDLLAMIDARDRENEELRVFLVIAAAGLVTADEKEDDAPASAFEHREEVKDTLLQACPNTEEEWARLVAKGVLGPIRAKLCLARHALYGEINKLERENAELREVVQSLQQEGSGRLRYD